MNLIACFIEGKYFIAGFETTVISTLCCLVNAVNPRNSQIRLDWQN